MSEKSGGRFRCLIMKERLVVAVGAVLAGTVIPAMLMTVYVGFHDSKATFISSVLFFFILEIIAIISCGPGAAFGCLILFSSLKKQFGYRKCTDLKKVLLEGAKLGAICSFFNIPGFLTITFLETAYFWGIYLVILFLITGVACGMWTGWCVFKSINPDVRFSFSFKTFFIVMLLSQVLIAVMALAPQKPRVPIIGSRSSVKGAFVATMLASHERKNRRWLFGKGVSFNNIPTSTSNLPVQSFSVPAVARAAW